MRKVRTDRRVPSSDVLQELVAVHRLTYKQIALMYDVSSAAVGFARAPESKRKLEARRRRAAA
jgi:hypothetical protein